MTPVVLVVEDEPSIAEVVALYLRRAGFEVLSAGDGEEALAMLAQATPDLVVLDLMLPKVERLRGHAPAAGARRHAHHHADGAQSRRPSASRGSRWAPTTTW